MQQFSHDFILRTRRCAHPPPSLWVYRPRDRYLRLDDLRLFDTTLPTYHPPCANAVHERHLDDMFSDPPSADVRRLQKNTFCSIRRYPVFHAHASDRSSLHHVRLASVFGLSADIRGFFFILVPDTFDLVIELLCFGAREREISWRAWCFLFGSG